MRRSRPAAAAGAGGRAGEARAAGASSRRPIWSIFASSRRVVSPVAPSPSLGVSTASSAPAPIASNTRQAFAPMQLVTIRIAHGRSDRMIRRVASIPSNFGMIRSISTISGGCAAHSSTACAPSVATHSTRCSGRRAIARRIASTASGRSLTMPMFTSGILRSVRSVGGGPGSWKGLPVRRRRTASAAGRHDILFGWRRPHAVMRRGGGNRKIPRMVPFQCVSSMTARCLPTAGEPGRPACRSGGFGTTGRGSRHVTVAASIKRRENDG